ncbi:peptidase T [Clostridium grantii]|uniref:Peptidase T n=1 Tax=Clostridium grantii DSM 8605 TaxID=1121316 RepID=A0A1M5XI67_9CLOT|nr:peptidase T [Clostridium grantii]SHH99555.1 peptidase T. Metallo peptidase. MEROPS family M20B [Clostridium grantii DSM 8605]
MDNLKERFLRYVKVDTRADEDANKTPSTESQLVFAKELVKELKDIGLVEVSVDEKAYVMATLPSNIEKSIPTIGFIAHMDTAPDYSGTNVKPNIIENYDGKDILLNKEENIIMKVKDFPELKQYKSHTLITTDGTTLLGADDKAGIAEIITAMEYLIAHPEIKHGKIRIGFTPDEEIGQGADYFDVEKFGAQLAYTMDGGKIGELQFENFNAAGVKINVKGRNVHPGSAKGKMINSIFIGNELMNKLPKDEVPEKTCGYEGFYFLTDFKGSVEDTSLELIIRDFCRENFEKRKEFLFSLEKELNQRYGEGTITIEIKDQYFNMKKKFEDKMYIVDKAKKAMELCGIEAIVDPIRGGTDGARLSFMGLPTPNIFAGGHNFHGKFEFVPLSSMEKAVEVIIKIAELYGE